ncbi:MAG: iron-sulfur cluster assembly accessory protein [Bacteroidia bacterium]|nr:iron-sulfur cluster assembly accessory protein [Bacteroidia bacterium]
MAEVQTPLVTFTPSAIKELKDIQVKESVDGNKILRVGVKGGGCSGLTYILEFDERGDMDDILEVEGLKVAMDKRHALYVMGMEVDYQYGLNDRGFIFKNPNAKDSCGCGVSFST